MTTLAVLIQTFSSLIQASMTIGVLIVTLLYVIFTKKMLDQNYSTFVVITSLKHSGKKITADIENHGTTMALNVSINASPGRKNSRKRLKLNGPGMISAGEKVIFTGEIPSGFETGDISIEISYRSQTRKKRTEAWKIRGEEITYLGNI